ncbi:hypothetical protein [Oceanibacterium hippocampi]|uniref:Uncharacterized protein n=1 Tax=Oceanibacterium hippocampi TaxID=745714 RepID=A0A1Y5TSX8_9PROT|nr:hypothetical protein [Oceanibacterium hippocampi]SLN68911.1 hypothetical protein OCH7691_03141 [Oceanibacterium hippocampi]
MTAEDWFQPALDSISALGFSIYDFVILALAFVGLVFYFISVLPGSARQLATRRETIERLHRFASKMQEDGGAATTALRHCFGAGNQHEAVTYLRTVQSLPGIDERAPTPLATADRAETHFLPVRIVISFARELAFSLALGLLGLSLLSVLAGTYLGGTDSGYRIHAVSIAAPALAALLVFLPAQALYTAQSRALARMCALLDELFLVPANVLFSNEMIATIENASRAQQEALDATKVDIQRAIASGRKAVSKLLTERESAIGKVIAEAVTASLRVPSERLAQSAAELGREQSDSVRDMTQEVLRLFSAELPAIEEKRMEDVARLMSGTLKVVEKLRESVDTLTVRLEGEIATDVSASIESLSARVSEIIASETGELVQRLREDGNDEVRAGARIIEEAAGALAAATADLRGAVDRASRIPAPRATPVEADHVRDGMAKASREIAKLLGDFENETSRLAKGRTTIET